ncbi:hypothetical protein ACET3X_003308 [Alternaria dauci]|uniref:GDP/GTP exchange factor Sec2 N-terminal domain-containing protein n=1 Tax=Alternaria dauci TaxID=48095 RepID=A0ABR3US45_9PLEO
MSPALTEGEQHAKDGVLEPLPKKRNTALRQEENPNGPLPVLNMPQGSPEDGVSPPPTLNVPSSPPQVAAMLAPLSLTLDEEFRIIETELAKCKSTREALDRREAALLERKAEITRETNMRLDEEMREMAVRDQDEDIKEGLYMRDVQRRVQANIEMAGKDTNQATENSQQLEEAKEENVIPVSAPERRRLARLALFKNDPRLG